jgi:hypothetical protein
MTINQSIFIVAIIYFIVVLGFLLPTLNIYYYEILEGRIKSQKISFLRFLKEYSISEGGNYSLHALPYYLNSDNYKDDYLKSICRKRNITSLLLLLHFLFFLFPSIIYIEEINHFIGN